MRTKQNKISQFQATLSLQDLKSLLTLYVEGKLTKSLNFAIIEVSYLRNLHRRGNQVQLPPLPPYSILCRKEQSSTVSCGIQDTYHDCPFQVHALLLQGGLAECQMSVLHFWTFTTYERMAFQPPSPRQWLGAWDHSGRSFRISLSSSDNLRVSRPCFRPFPFRSLRSGLRQTHSFIFYWSYPLSFSPKRRSLPDFPSSFASTLDSLSLFLLKCLDDIYSLQTLYWLISSRSWSCEFPASFLKVVISFRSAGILANTTQVLVGQGCDHQLIVTSISSSPLSSLTFSTLLARCRLPGGILQSIQQSVSPRFTYSLGAITEQ